MQSNLSIQTKGQTNCGLSRRGLIIKTGGLKGRIDCNLFIYVDWQWESKPINFESYSCSVVCFQEDCIWRLHHGMRSLPGTSIHNQKWKSSPRSLAPYSVTYILTFLLKVIIIVFKSFDIFKPLDVLIRIVFLLVLLLWFASICIFIQPFWYHLCEFCHQSGFAWAWFT